ncbi:MAG: energy transducer TonB [Bacteroidales bacterium]|nr:energy transducer TonB [Bacteroidales bacterium]
MRVLFKNNITGVLGTIVFHLALLVAFLSFKLDEVKKKHKEFMVIDFQEQEFDVQEAIQKKIQELAEIVPLPDQTRKNIAVNAARQIEDEISTEKYLEQLKEELGIKELNQQLDRDIEDEEFPTMEEKKPKPSDKKEKTYSGPTNITYFLENRSDRNLPVPVYKCEGGGEVTIEIIVDQKGRVVNAEISKSSTTASYCLQQVALNYAQKSVFNIDLNAPLKQKGTITYIFIPQY